MGVRTKTVKRAARVIIEKYYGKLTIDFQTNKRICEEVASIPSKKLRNKIAGFVTHLMKRIQRGPVRGISLKLQEEEREKRLDFVPTVSHVDAVIQQGLLVDPATMEMLAAMDFGDVAVEGAPYQRFQGGRGGRGGRGGGRGGGAGRGGAPRPRGGPRAGSS